MRIVGYLQAKDELSKGNLERCLTNLSLTIGEDNFVIYDDGSTDGSQEIYKQYTSHIIQGDGGQFTNELFIKQQLIEYCRDNLQGDWIAWIDADAVFSRSATDDGAIQELVERGEIEDVQGWYAHWHNAYLHPRWKRLDQQYDSYGQLNIYKIIPGIQINCKPGLHQRQTPLVGNEKDQDRVSIVHLGFASVDAIAQKYIQYYNHGQRHWALERIISMADMKLELIPDEVMPKHFCPEPGPCPQPVNFDALRRAMPPFSLDEIFMINEYRTRDA